MLNFLISLNETLSQRKKFERLKEFDRNTAFRDIKIDVSDVNRPMKTLGIKTIKIPYPLLIYFFICISSVVILFQTPSTQITQSFDFDFAIFHGSVAETKVSRKKNQHI